MENEKYLANQLITYLGNKRSLLSYIQSEIELIHLEMGVTRTKNLDLFSGSGSVSRLLKRYSSKLIANDLELYSKIINECYLTNKSEFPSEEYAKHKKNIENLIANGPSEYGVISANYAPQDDADIQLDERVFYTTRNAKYIDTLRKHIDDVPENLRKYFLAPLIYEASVKTNTSGIFKGFHKNTETGIGQFGGTGNFALSRITSDIEISEPIFSDYNCDVDVYQEDSNELVKRLTEIDITYIDPPYNQHPYGSNYFMLNVIAENSEPLIISRVSGIPKFWNRSNYNIKREALKSLKSLLVDLDSKYVIISYNSEGFISYSKMMKMLQELYQNVRISEITYNTYKGSRNLGERDLYVKEFLFVVSNKIEEVKSK